MAGGWKVAGLIWDFTKLGIPIMRIIVVGVYIGAPIFWKRPYSATGPCCRVYIGICSLTIEP